MDFATYIAQSNSVQHDQFGQEDSMKLPEDICLKIEKSADKEDILLCPAQHQDEGVGLSALGAADVTLRRASAESISAHGR